MIQQSIDLFQKEQTMDAPDFEVYNYSDKIPPKVFPHTHQFYEIYYLLSDTLTYMIEGREYQMKKGDFLMVPPDVMHYPSDMNVRQGGSYSRIVLWINKDFFENITSSDSLTHEMWNLVKDNQNFHVRPTPKASQEIHESLKRLIQEQKNKNLSTALMSQAILMEILVQMNRTIHTMNHFEKHLQTSSLFSNVISYIHENLGEDLSLDNLAEKFYVSKGYISKLFREYMGVPVHQYILMLRLEECRKAMENDIPIASCIEQYGFKDYSSFFRAFKGAFQMSPREYQKSMTQK